MTPTELSTPRARLRAWTAEDVPRLFDMRSRPEVATWMGDPTPWPDLAHASARVREWEDLLRGGGPYGTWAIQPHDEATPVGSVNLGRLDGDEYDIGWCLHPDAVGQGWAREAGAAVLDHAWQHGLDRVWAVMWAHNDPSAAVARALGMADLGVRPDPWYGTEEDPESLMFRIDAP